MAHLFLSHIYYVMSTWHSGRMGKKEMISWTKSDWVRFCCGHFDLIKSLDCFTNYQAPAEFLWDPISETLCFLQRGRSWLMFRYLCFWNKLNDLFIYFQFWKPIQKPNKKRIHSLGKSYMCVNFFVGIVVPKDLNIFQDENIVESR